MGLEPRDHFACGEHLFATRQKITIPIVILMVIPNLTIPIVIPMGNLPLELLWSFKADRDVSPPYKQLCFNFNLCNISEHSFSQRSPKTVELRWRWLSKLQTRHGQCEVIYMLPDQ